MGSSHQAWPSCKGGYLLPYPRNCCRWLVSRTATLLLEVQLVPSVTSLRPPMPPSARPTPSSPLICGRRQCSRSLLTKSTLTSWPSTTNHWDSRDKNRSNIKRFHHHESIKKCCLTLVVAVY